MDNSKLLGDSVMIHNLCMVRHKRLGRMVVVCETRTIITRFVHDDNQFMIDDEIWHNDGCYVYPIDICVFWFLFKSQPPQI